MEFIKTILPEVILIKPKIFGDERGFFMETYKKSLFENNGIYNEFIQDNHSKSSAGVLRGLHYQIAPKAQAKIVRCISGAVFDVAVDIRKGSPTYGKWVGYELSDYNHNMLYIPHGFAHGFLTLSDYAQLVYKTDNEYSLAHDRGIIFNDKQVSINWPAIKHEIILSEKDKKQPLFNEIETNFLY